MIQVLSPKELARAIGVSESSLKRWADDGLIKTSRTAGGHRRIALTDALRFIRESRSLLVNPDVLGLTDVRAVRSDDTLDQSDSDRLFAYLRDGRAAEARGLLLSRYLDGESLAAMFDGFLREAMEQLGRLWQHSETGIILEHRATDICVQAVQQLRSMLPPQHGGPVAVGGAPSGDPYLLPSLLVATALMSESYDAMNLGPETPCASLLRAADEFDAKLVWLSISVAQRPDEMRQDVIKLACELGTRGTRLIVGGQKCGVLDLPTEDNMLVGQSVAELVAFGRGLLAGSSGEAATTAH